MRFVRCQPACAIYLRRSRRKPSTPSSARTAAGPPAPDEARARNLRAAHSRLLESRHRDALVHRAAYRRDASPARDEEAVVAVDSRDASVGRSSRWYLKPILPSSAVRLARAGALVQVLLNEIGIAERSCVGRGHRPSSRHRHRNTRAVGIAVAVFAGTKHELQLVNASWRDLFGETRQKKVRRPS